MPGLSKNDGGIANAELSSSMSRLSPKSGGKVVGNWGGSSSSIVSFMLSSNRSGGLRPTLSSLISADTPGLARPLSSLLGGRASLSWGGGTGLCASLEVAGFGVALSLPLLFGFGGGAGVTGGESRGGGGM